MLHRRPRGNDPHRRISTRATLAPPSVPPAHQCGGSDPDIVDDGRGMRRRSWPGITTWPRAQGSRRRYRFAVVGIKLDCSCPLTCHRDGGGRPDCDEMASRIATPRALEVDSAARLTDSRGTAVRLTLNNHLSRLSMRAMSKGSFVAISSPCSSGFDDLTRRHYRNGLSFEVDCREPIRAEPGDAERAGCTDCRAARRPPGRFLGVRVSFRPIVRASPSAHSASD